MRGKVEEVKVNGEMELKFGDEKRIEALGPI